MLILFFLIVSCAGNCIIKITTKQVSPDGKHLAIKHWQDCGAIANGQPQISILTLPDTLPEMYGNVVKDCYGIWIEKWLSNDTLLLKVTPGTKLNYTRNEFNGITILYSGN